MIVRLAIAWPLVAVLILPIVAFGQDSPRILEAARALELSTGKIDAEVSFDEFSLDIDMRYDGEPMEFPIERPTDTDLRSRSWRVF